MRFIIDHWFNCVFNLELNLRIATGNPHLGKQMRTKHMHYWTIIVEESWTCKLIPTLPLSGSTYSLKRNWSLHIARIHRHNLECTLPEWPCLYFFKKVNVDYVIYSDVSLDTKDCPIVISLGLYGNKNEWHRICQTLNEKTGRKA